MSRLFSYAAVLALAASSAGALAQSAAPKSGLSASQVALVINDDEPNSVEIGEYYRQARQIPEANVVHVRIPKRPHKLSVEQFTQLKARIDSQLGPNIQALVMVWTAPYAVECNSITSAYTLGYDAEQCVKTCGPGKPSAYFNSPSAQPFTDHGMRLSMLLPTDSVAGAKALIGRGTASGFRVPAATAYYLTTSDTARSSRAQFFPPSGQFRQRKLTVKNLKADSIENEQDIMIYQTGLSRVPKLDTLRFMPGALADHLTSFGGDLLAEGQMSSLRWLDAGATASYGTVSEPCNYWQKFPNPAVLLRSYLSGASAIESYWRSVAWPAQGVFIGEALAAPYKQR